MFYYERKQKGERWDRFSSETDPHDSASVQEACTPGEWRTLLSVQLCKQTLHPEVQKDVA
ncbi:hypothetical protein EYF80_016987 [Liparis tanakae]|uniref:Uncharacterized protein n=1 Tax=Liparis tanakae TaxID=230148 RepID=A0A4Z2I649_9TELE|nr:hypothetical protein EYF80_016987 [Liparis tanakae]